MATKSLTCAGCRRAIKTKEFMKCAVCGLLYDLECSSFTSQRFGSMTPVSKQSWKCPMCRCAEPRTDNTNTPARSGQQSSHDMNVTIRNNNRPRRISSDSEPIDQSSDDRLRAIIREEICQALKSAMGGSLTEQLKSINEKISAFEHSLTFYNTMYEDLKSDLVRKGTVLTQLQKENEGLQATIKSIEREMTTRLGAMEQTMRECNVEIGGLPEYQSENLFNTLEQISKKVDVTLTRDDVQHVTRVAKLNKDSPRPRAVVAKLRTRLLRDGLLAAVTKFNKQNPQDRLNSHHLGIGGSSVPIFVSEHLSPGNKYLHAAARRKAREVGFRFVWVRDGRIYARKNESSQALLIRSQESLVLIK